MDKELRDWKNGDPLSAAHLQEVVEIARQVKIITGGDDIQVGNHANGTTLSLKKKTQNVTEWVGEITTPPVGRDEFENEQYWVRPMYAVADLIANPIEFKFDRARFLRSPTPGDPSPPFTPDPIIATNVSETVEHSHTLKAGSLIIVTVIADRGADDIRYRYLFQRLPDSNIRGKVIGQATGVGWYLANSISGNSDATGTDDLEEVHLGDLAATDLLVANLQEVGTDEDEHQYDTFPLYFTGVVIGTVPSGIYAGRRIVIASALWGPFPPGGRPAIIVAHTPVQTDEQYWFKWATLTGGTAAADPVFAVDVDDVTPKLANNLAEATAHSHTVKTGSVIFVSQVKNEAGELAYVFERPPNSNMRGKIISHATGIGWYLGNSIGGNSAALGTADLAEADLGDATESELLVINLQEVGTTEALHFWGTSDTPMYSSGAVYFTGVIIGVVPSGTYVGKRICIASAMWGSAESMPVLGVNGEGPVDASLLEYALSDSINTQVRILCRVGYHHDTDEILAGYIRTFTFRSGLLTHISGETRYEIDAPTDCSAEIDGGTF